MKSDLLASSRILLVNDDGIDAPGIAALRAAFAPLCDLWVVAPMTEKSGAGCSLSLIKEMAVEERKENGRTWGYAVEGTPADCVKFAMTALDLEPDLILSGVNRGRNVGNSIWYSGTVAGALEATMFGIRAMAVSSACFGAKEFHYESAAQMACRIAPWLLTQSWRPRSFWNLNVPNEPLASVRGVRFACQGTGYFVDDFEKSREESGVSYYRNRGERLEVSPEPSNSDDIVVDEGYAALSLLTTDLTIDVPRAASEALEREWNQLVFGRPPLDDPGTG